MTMTPDDPLHQRPGLGSGKPAPEELFDDRAGEPGAKVPIPTDPTWRDIVVMLALGAVIVLTIFAVHPAPRPYPTVNISTAVRVPPNAATRPDVPDDDDLVPCSDPEHVHEKCRAR
jgi:hypothetical protein